MKTNKTIKLVDLIVKIANKEELPKKIMHNNIIYLYDGEITNYIKVGYIGVFLIGEDITAILNDEVEIIEDVEEDKKIEKLKLFAPYPECDDTRFDDIEDKINELIDIVNDLKGGE